MRSPIDLPGGSFSMGDASGDGNRADGETPVHQVTVSPFSIDATTVTNDAFEAFVDATDHRTEAEVFGSSAVFHTLLDADDDSVIGPSGGARWWLGVRGADWRHPAGNRSDLEGRGDHPVVHVSWNDAVAYCAWAGRRLPTEAEWEYASRGGLDGARFPWGDDRPAEGEGGRWPLNIWQGRFPFEDTAEDGWAGTAPAEHFEPNGFGLFQTVGNVWEWCVDWFDATTYERTPALDPTGPAEGRARVLRGGSFLCHDSYCNRYRNAARTSNTPDSSSQNLGFRTVGEPGQRAENSSEDPPATNR